MSKPILIAIVGIILVTGLGAFAFMQLNKPSDNQTAPTSTTENTTQPVSSRSSIKTLLAQGGNAQCTATFESGSGTFYLSGQKMRGDFTTSTDGQSSNGHIIRDSEYTYVWSDTIPQGTKFKISEEDQVSASQKGGVNLDQEAQVSCSSWSVDSSQFVLPTEITFTDLTETIKQIPQTNQMQNLQPSSCDSITDPTAKAACVQALGN